MKCKGVVTFMMCCSCHSDSSNVVYCHLCDNKGSGNSSGLVVDVVLVVMVVKVVFLYSQ